jgi:hypothetical protein
MTATTTIPTRPTRPAQPLELRNLIDCHNASMAALNGAFRGASAGLNTSEAITRYGNEVIEWNTMITEWSASPDGRAYAAAVNEYNAKAVEFNEALKAAQQARRNAIEIKKVRSAACPQCFSTHAGEC